MPMVEEYSDAQLWQVDFDCWLNGEELKHGSRLSGTTQSGAQVAGRELGSS